MGQLLNQFIIISFERLPLNEVEQSEAADIVEKAPVIRNKRIK
jgi:hypothetical protein